MRVFYMQLCFPMCLAVTGTFQRCLLLWAPFFSICPIFFT